MSTTESGVSSIMGVGTIPTWLLDDVALYLEDTVGLVGGNDLFASLMPDDLEGIVTGIFEYSGGAPTYVMGEDQSLPAWSNPSLQVVVRADPGQGQGYEAAVVLINTITQSLERVVNQYINGTLYYRIARSQDPFLMDRDARRRVYMVCNFTVMRKPN